MADKNDFLLRIITPDRVFYENRVDMVEFNTTEGEIGILPGHIPMTVIVKPGILSITAYACFHPIVTSRRNSKSYFNTSIRASALCNAVSALAISVLGDFPLKRFSARSFADFARSPSISPGHSIVSQPGRGAGTAAGSGVFAADVSQ